MWPRLIGVLTETFRSGPFVSGTDRNVIGWQISGQIGGLRSETFRSVLFWSRISRSEKRLSVFVQKPFGSLTTWRNFPEMLSVPVLLVGMRSDTLRKGQAWPRLVGMSSGCHLCAHTCFKAAAFDRKPVGMQSECNIFVGECSETSRKALGEQSLWRKLFGNQSESKRAEFSLRKMFGNLSRGNRSTKSLETLSKLADYFGGNL